MYTSRQNYIVPEPSYYPPHTHPNTGQIYCQPKQPHPSSQHPQPHSSSITQTQLQTLQSYSSNLTHQIRHLQLQIQQDTTQMSLIVARCDQIQHVLMYQREDLGQEMRRLRERYEGVVRVRDQLEERNLGNVGKLREGVQWKERCLGENGRIKMERNTINAQINQLNKPDKGIIPSIQQLSTKTQQQQTTTVQKITTLHHKIQSLKTTQQSLHQNIQNLTQNQTKTSQKLHKLASTTQKILSNINQQQQQHIYLKNNNKLFVKNRQQLHQNINTISQKISVQDQQYQYLLDQQQDLVYQLELKLKQLEIQQRGREQEQYKIQIEQTRVRKNIAELEELRAYLDDLVESNSKFKELLGYYQGRDVVQAEVLLKRVSSKSNVQEIYQHKKQLTATSNVRQKKQNLSSDQPSSILDSYLKPTHRPPISTILNTNPPKQPKQQTQRQPPKIQPKPQQIQQAFNLYQHNKPQKQISPISTALSYFPKSPQQKPPNYQSDSRNIIQTTTQPNPPPPSSLLSQKQSHPEPSQTYNPKSYWLPRQITNIINKYQHPSISVGQNLSKENMPTVSYPTTSRYSNWGYKGQGQGQGENCSTFYGSFYGLL